MLKIPSFRSINDVTVYQDDGVWYQFYLVANLPSIRLDKNNKPVFLLANYHISQQARDEDESLPRGGGFMNFDVQFAVSKSDRKTAKKELQDWVDQEYTKRKADSQYASLPEYSSVKAPEVVIADPLLSEGRVSMHTVQSEILATHRLAEGPASLVSGSTAVFNIDLTETGASFMKELMLDENNTGRVDLTPISVIYDLKMWARLPPIKITVTGESERIHKTLNKISETNKDNPCTPSEVETYRNNGVNSSNLKENGSVKVVVDKGDASVPDEVVETLQDYALDLFDTMIEERFLIPAESDEQDLEFDSDAPEIGEADPGWSVILYDGKKYSGNSEEIREETSKLSKLNNKASSVLVRNGYKATLYTRPGFKGNSMHIKKSVSHLGGRMNNTISSVKIWKPPTSRYMVRKSVNHSEMNLEITVDRSQVVEWPLVAQATLQTFFTGMSKEQISKHVVDVFADSFRTLGVKVRAFADFENTNIRAVEVQVEYEARDSTGENREEPRGFTFAAGDVEPELFDPPVIEGKREYKYRYRVIYSNDAKTEFTEWQETNTTELNVSVEDPGKIDLEFSASVIKWDVVKVISIRLKYENTEIGIEPVSESIELTSLSPVDKWVEPFSKEISGNIEAKITYHMVDDKVLERDVERIDVTENLFVVPPPQVDILNVGLLPAGNWGEVEQAVVSLRYDAGDGRVFDRMYRINSAEQFVEWTVLLRDSSRRKFEYETVVVYKNGQDERSGWIEKEGDQTILVKAKGEPRMIINVMSALVDFAQTPAVTVKLIYGNEQTTLSFVNKDSQSWSVPKNAQGDDDFSYVVTWHPVDGDPITSQPVRTDSREVFIQKAELPTAGKLRVIIRGFAIDFDRTPFVDVSLRWVDGDMEESTFLTLTKDEKNKSWEVDIGDRSQRQYKYEITYNLADGTRVEGRSDTTDDPVISITPLQD